MENQIIICKNCGAVCEQKQNFCRKCGIRLKQETVNDYGIKQLQYFIGPKSERYINVFKKNQDKKYFLHMNWAAFFFNIYWAFYRKMYAVGITFLLIALLVNYTIISMGAGTVRQQYDSLITEAMVSVGAEIECGKNASEIALNDLSPQTQLAILINLLPSFTVYGIILWVASIVLQIGFALIADCLYRNYVFKRINYSDGGVSVGATIASMLLEPVIVWVATLVVFKLISIFLF